MRHIELHIKENNDSDIETPTELVNLLKQKLAAGDLSTIEAAATALSTKTIEAEIDCRATKGITGGCYGARDGKTYKGLTLWIDHTELPDRWKDSDDDTVVNIVAHIEDCEGKEIELGCCPLNDLNLRLLTEGNTYSYEADFYVTAEVNYKIYDLGNAVLLEAEVHYGGDIRGNYAMPLYYKFEREEDAISALYPQVCEEEEEI